MQRVQTGSRPLVPPRRWLAGSLDHRGGEAAPPPWPGRQHAFSRDSTYSGVLCWLSHLSLLTDMQAPLGCRLRGGVGRPTSDSPDQLLQNMRRCIRVGGGVRRPSFGLMGIPSLCRRVGGHWELARCRRSQEARRRRGRLRLQRESNGQLSKDPFRRCQNVGPGTICKEKARSTSPHESGRPWTPGRLHREFRSEGNSTTVISGRYDDGSGKRSPKESLCGHYRLTLPLVPPRQHEPRSLRSSACHPGTHTATPSLLEIVTSRMHFDSITHLHYLASLPSLATGLLRPCPVSRRAVPSTMTQEGQDILTDEKRRPSGPGARNHPGEPGSRRHMHMSGTQKILPVPRWHAILLLNPTASGLPYWEGKGKLAASSLATSTGAEAAEEVELVSFAAQRHAPTPWWLVECESRRQPEDVSVRPAGHGGGRTRHPKLTSSEVGRCPGTGRFGDRCDTTKCAVARRSVGRDRRCPSARLGDGKKGWVWSLKVYKVCAHHQVRHSSGSRHRGHEHTSCYTSLEQPWHALSSMNRSGGATLQRRVQCRDHGAATDATHRQAAAVTRMSISVRCILQSYRCQQHISH